MFIKNDYKLLSYEEISNLLQEGKKIREDVEERIKKMIKIDINDRSEKCQ